MTKDKAPDETLAEAPVEEPQEAATIETTVDAEAHAAVVAQLEEVQELNAALNAQLDEAAIAVSEAAARADAAEAAAATSAALLEDANDQLAEAKAPVEATKKIQWGVPSPAYVPEGVEPPPGLQRAALKAYVPAPEDTPEKPSLLCPFCAYDAKDAKNPEMALRQHLSRKHQ